MSSADAKHLGEHLEELIIASIDEIEPVEQRDYWYDAIANRPIGPDHEISIVDSLEIATDTPIEIKCCQIRVSNGGGTTTSGRWFLKKKQHQQLIEAGGVYLLVVYDDDELEPISIIAIPARSLEDIISSWSDINRRDDAISKLSWSRVFDPAQIEAEIGGAA